MEILESGIIDISKLSVSNFNVRSEIPKDLTKLKNSLKNIGLLQPIIIDENNEILSGQLRYLMCKEVGIAKLPYIKVKCNSNYEKRLISMVQDYIRYDLTDKMRYEFVMDALNKDNKGIKEIADSLGIKPQTVKNWLVYGDVPKQFKEEQKQTYFELPSKKKHVIKAICQSPKFKEDISKITQALDFIRSVALRDAQQVKKEAVRGLDIDFEYRKEILSGDTVLLEFKIPKSIFNKFIKKLRKHSEDFVKVVIRLLESYIKS